MEDSVKAIKRIDKPLMDSKDVLIWTGNDMGIFSVKSCYEVLQQSKDIDTVHGVWRQQWKANIHERLKVFLWRLASNILPTKDVLNKRWSLLDDACCLCGDFEETTIHLFKECMVTRAVAYGGRWGLKIDQIYCNNLIDLVSWSLSVRHTGWEKEVLPIVVVSFLYTIWRFMNERLFEGKKLVAQVVSEWDNMVEEFVAEVASRGSYDRMAIQCILVEAIWVPPCQGIIMVDTCRKYQN